MQERVHQALELVGMSDFKKREPARLSGGQKQRVAIAGVVALGPTLSSLMKQLVCWILDLIRTVKDIKDHYDMTVISITHDLDEVALSLIELSS